MENKKFFQIKNIIPIIIVIIVLGLFAVAFLGPIIKGIFFSTQKAFIYTTGQSTTGTVIGYETISNVQRNGNITYYYVPKVKFNTNYNEAIQTASKLNEIEAPMLTPGSVVNIKYSLSNPNNFIITDHNLTLHTTKDGWILQANLSVFLLKKNIIVKGMPLPLPRQTI